MMLFNEFEDWLREQLEGEIQAQLRKRFGVQLDNLLWGQLGGQLENQINIGLRNL